jgi:hypothetical protein
MIEACRLAHDLLELPIRRHDFYSAPMEIRPATTDERCAHLDYRGGAASLPLPCDAPQPLIVCWRAGGFDGDGDEQHVWYMPKAEAAQRGISEHDLAWATSEAIIYFRFATQRLPRACAIQVVIFELEGHILRVVEHAQLAARVRTTLH